jgi:hypothetical protein
MTDTTDLEFVADALDGAADQLDDFTTNDEAIEDRVADIVGLVRKALSALNEVIELASDAEDDDEEEEEDEDDEDDDWKDDADVAAIVAAARKR